MSDLASLRAVLKIEAKSNSDFVDIAIADAIRFVRSEPLWFNGARHSFTTIEDQYRYALPADYLGLRGKVRVVPGNSTTTGKYTMYEATTDEIEDFLYAGVDYGSTQEIGTAKRFAIEFFGKEMLIAPIPSTAGDRVEFKYTKDLGTPTYTITATSSTPPSLSTTVTLKGPNEETLASTFTNEWFKEGFKLIKERALYELFSRFHSGTEESTIGAQGALNRFLEELVRLRKEAAQQQSPAKIRKHL